MTQKQKIRRYQGKRGKPFLNVFLALLLLGILCFGVLEGMVLAGSQSSISGSPRIMVILGAQVKSYGPSILLQDRLDTALDYLADHPDMSIIVTGGQGADEPCTEAKAMYDYLTANGIDGSKILMEDQAHNTSQNLKFTIALMQEKGIDPEAGVLVVSNGFHLCRVRMLASRYGLEISTLAAPSSHMPSRMFSYLREVPALVKSFVLDR